MTPKLISPKRLRIWRRHAKVWLTKIRPYFTSSKVLHYFSILVVIMLSASLFVLLSNRIKNLHPLPPVSPPASEMPVSQGQKPPAITARNYFVLDLTSRMVLLQKAADTHIYPASTTKMMTALVVIDHFPLTQTITVTKSYPLGQNLGFKPGEQITVEKLLYALLVYSANDAAEILAENFPGGRPAFIAAMNQKATDFRLFNTHFVNPTGLDEDNHYSSAADLVRLADLLMKNPELARIVSTENAILSSSDYSSSHIVTNINELLGHVEGVLGVKTGYTDGAGQALVTLVSRRGHPVMISVMGSVDRFADTRQLIEWVYSNHQWVSPTSTGSGQSQIHTP